MASTPLSGIRLHFSPKNTTLLKFVEELDQARMLLQKENRLTSLIGGNKSYEIQTQPSVPHHERSQDIYFSKYDGKTAEGENINHRATTTQKAFGNKQALPMGRRAAIL